MFQLLCFLPLYRVEWLLIKDFSSHRSFSSGEVRKKAKVVKISTEVAQLRLSSGLQGLQFEIQSLRGQRLESLDPVAFFHFVKSGLLPLYLLYYVNREVFQGVACRIKMFCHQFLQTSMFDIRMVAIHTYVEHILCLSYILFFLHFLHLITQTTFDILQFALAFTRYFPRH